MIALLLLPDLTTLTTIHLRQLDCVISNNCPLITPRAHASFHLKIK